MSSRARDGGEEEGAMQNGKGSMKWDVARAAEELGVSPHTLRAWLRQRRLPYLKLGRRIILDPEDVQRFMDANRVEAVSFERRG
jgi:excisionase family DNA binding protein